MSQHLTISNQLKSALKLTLSPIGIAFHEKAPAHVPSFKGRVPAGCVFWLEATNALFSTSTKDHELCAIGVHTHNMEQPSDDYSGELQGALAAMSGLDYVREEEVSQIPVLPQQTKHIVYGPLDQFLERPDVVLLFVHSQQGLILSEAISREDKNIPLAMGRPACAVIPQVINQGAAAMSLGCCGARAYLDKLSDDLALWALPGKKIEAYCDQIMIFAKGNETLSLFHQYRKEDVKAGRIPSVKESLDRLSQ